MNQNLKLYEHQFWEGFGPYSSIFTLDKAGAVNGLRFYVLLVSMD